MRDAPHAGDITKSQGDLPATRAACGPGAISVSVVICAYTEDRWDDLVGAVGSVLQQCSPPIEVIVVIDHNERLMRRACDRFQNLKVIGNSNSRGLSGARNAGTAASQGSIVAFLDDDAIAAPDWLQNLSSGYGDPRVLGVGGIVRPRWAGPRPRWFPEEYEWVVGCTYRGVSTSPKPVRNLIGANMSFRKDVIVASGGFNSGIGQIGASMMRCDDTEFCIRASARFPGGKVMFEPSAVVHHSVPESRKTWQYYIRRCFTEGKAKAEVTRMVGANRGLSSERDHVLRTLPLGVLRGLTDAFIRRDPNGLARSSAIILGLAAATTGYAAGTVSCSSTSVVRETSRRPGSATTSKPVRLGTSD